jgi:hypothetical protein
MFDWCDATHIVSVITPAPVHVSAVKAVVERIRSAAAAKANIFMS